MKQNYEADIQDLERKLKESQARGGGAAEASEDYYYSEDNDDAN